MKECRIKSSEIKKDYYNYYMKTIVFIYFINIFYIFIYCIKKYTFHKCLNIL